MRNERGMSGSVQMAILFPLTIGMFLLALQWALWTWADATANAAAEDGARAAAMHGSNEAAGLEAAKRATEGDALANVRIDVDRGATHTTVKVRGEALSVIPLMHSQVTATATVPTERVTRS